MGAQISAGVLLGRVLSRARGEDPVICADALPCPFCGGPATIQPWHGGGPRKRYIGCADDNDCDIGPGISGPTRKAALKKWNRRA